MRIPIKFLQSKQNFFATRGHSKTPAENRMDITGLYQPNFTDKSDKFSGGDEKFFPMSILSDKVLSDKVVRKLGEIHIL